MIPAVFLIRATALFTVAGASFEDAINNIQLVANDLASQISAWSSPDGLAGALGIQGDFPNLVDGLQSLSSAANFITTDDIDVQETKSLASSIIGLLQSLSEKSDDFRSVDADIIVKNDIESLQQPAFDVAQSIIVAIGNDCGKIISLTPDLNSYADAFYSVDSAYDIKRPTFNAPSCIVDAISTPGASFIGRGGTSASEPQITDTRANISSIEPTSDTSGRPEWTENSTSVTWPNYVSATNLTSTPTPISPTSWQGHATHFRSGFHNGTTPPARHSKGSGPENVNRNFSGSLTISFAVVTGSLIAFLELYLYQFN